MKHSIKIDPLRAVVIEPTPGQQVSISIQAAGVQLFRQLVTPDQAAILSQAFNIAAQQAAHKIGGAAA
jgi:hypothetical protein